MPRPPIDPNPEPTHQAIATALATAIARGDPPVGALLPPEPQLQRRFNATRYTVRRAVARLREAGLVSPQRGRGTLVLAAQPAPAYVQTMDTVDQLLGLTHELTVRLLDTCDVVADRALADRLDGVEGQAWVCARVLRMRGKAMPPIGLVRVYVRPAARDVIARLGRHRGPVFELFESMHGIRIVQIVQRVEAVNLAGADARLLQVARHACALAVTRHFLDLHQAVHQVSVGLYPGGRFAQTMRLRVGNARAGG